MRVNEAGGVYDGEALLDRQPAPGLHESRIAIGKRYGQAGRNERTPKRLQHHIDSRAKVEPRIALIRICGQLDVRIETLDVDGNA